MCDNLLKRNGYSLRAPEPEDLDVMYLFENETFLWETSNPTGPYSRFYLKEYITNNHNDLYTDRQLRLMIEDESGEVVGIVDLFHFDPFHTRAEVGIVIAPSHRRKGIASLALTVLNDYASRYLGLHQLYALTLAENTLAYRLFSNVGYSETGYFKEWVRTTEGYKDVVVMQKIF